VDDFPSATSSASESGSGDADESGEGDGLDDDQPAVTRFWERSGFGRAERASEDSFTSSEDYKPGVALTRSFTGTLKIEYKSIRRASIARSPTDTLRVQYNR
jgi:hypothetical protein